MYLEENTTTVEDIFPLQVIYDQCLVENNCVLRLNIIWLKSG